ncbi:carboxypeptidase-like regulatory domain-containing protein [Bizionia psychrotolerans]|uniref:carboxypeptidase-like regulatory domain-containing protein n=1 Tax=Bizionia psychrotolerans TaxID=1492901 RepID=UPI00065051AE|nr:carboxypeptidase-like regulatory domain-containing protein [Bizionia psychrotolerans]
MKNKLNVSIKTPCSENYNTFSPTKAGGFCNSCEKEVIDFTNMKSEAIINYFKLKNTQNTCGRFNSSQLTSFNPIPKTNKRLNLIGGLGLALLSFFSFTASQAQEKKTETTNNNSEVKELSQEKDISVKGTVLDENGLPLPGTNIVLKDTAIGTQTNFDGEFEFPEKLKKGDVLVFSFIGYSSKTIVINNENATPKIEMEVNMDAVTCIVMGKVAVKKVYKSKRNK